MYLEIVNFPLIFVLLVSVDVYYCYSLKLTSLELQYVSPKLLVCNNLELAVPGTYDPNQPIIRIQKVQSSLQVITSKQRPRKLSVFGESLCILNIYSTK